MAKQAGPVQFTGTIGNLTGYSMNGQYYLKKRSYVTRKKILTHPSYANTRSCFKYFAEAQKIASGIYLEYRRLMSIEPCISIPSVRLRKVWYPLRNRAQELVRKQMPLEEIKSLLRKEFLNKHRAASFEPQFQNIQKKIPGQPVPAHYNELFLGRQPNTGLIPELADQLSAATLLLQRLLNRQDKTTGLFDKERKKMEHVLKKFRQ